jgi:LemA protein
MTMKKILPLAIVIGLLVIIGGSLASTYNRLVTGRTGVRQAFAEVDNQLKRRNDLIPNLVETVKGIATQEQVVFGQIADARARLGGATTTADKIAADQQLTSALSRLLVVVENYPQLRSNENFLRLQDELAGTENRLGVARNRYNEATGAYNVMVQRFPTNIIAGLFKFTQEPFYQVTPEERQTPKVDFGGIRSGGQAAGDSAK